MSATANTSPDFAQAPPQGAGTGGAAEGFSKPSFLSIVKGMWTLTWRSHIGFKKLPGHAATILALPVLVFLSMKEGQPDVAFHWLIDFYLWLLLPLHCLSTCGAMIRDEIQADTLRFLITRPVKRMEVFLAKYVSQMIIVQILALCSASLLLLVLGLRHVPEIVSIASVFLSVQILAVLAYTALASLLGLINQRYMVVGILYGAVVEVGIGRIPTNVNNLSMTRHLRTLLANNPAIMDQYIWTPDGSVFSATMLITGTLIFLTLGAVLFTIREYHPVDEMQK